MSIEQWAARQHGLITHDQARRYGFSTRQIGTRVQSGQWVRLVRGVYRIGGAPVTWQQTALAACLAAPALTVASHLTAAALAGLAKAPILPHVTVPSRSSSRTPLARVHRSDLDASECTRLFGIPCTSVARTLVDCAIMVRSDALASMVDDALCRRITTVDAIQRSGARPGRKGMPRLRRALEPWSGNLMPGSPAEIRLQRQLTAWGYPTPVRQHPVYDVDGTLVGKLDLAWPDQGVGLEYDSDRWHNPRHWQRDETRHAAVVRLGWQLLHADKVDLRAGDRRFREDLERAWGLARVRETTSGVGWRTRRPA